MSSFMNEGKGSVLVVDDEVYIQEILTSILEQEGYQCVTAGSVDAALVELGARKFDLAFIDVLLPGRSGMDLLQLIRSGYPDTAAIMITGVSEASTEVEAAKMGAHDYIAKPFNRDQILESAGRALEHRRLEASSREYQMYLKRMVEERGAVTPRLLDAMNQALVRLMEMKNPTNVGHS